jgi:hypothetical protein
MKKFFSVGASLGPAGLVCDNMRCATLRGVARQLFHYTRRRSTAHLLFEIFDGE